MRRGLVCKEIAAPSVASALEAWNAHAHATGVDEDDLVSVNAMAVAPVYPLQFPDGDATQHNQVVVVFVYRRVMM